MQPEEPTREQRLAELEALIRTLPEGSDQRLVLEEALRHERFPRRSALDDASPELVRRQEQARDEDDARTDAALLEHDVREAAEERARTAAGESALRRARETLRSTAPLEPEKPEAQYSIRRQGGIWHIRFGDETGAILDSKGVSDIAHLLGRPMERIPARELVGEDMVEIELPTQAEIEFDAIPTRSSASADDSISEDRAVARENVANLQKRLNELKDDYAQANDDENEAEATRISTEMDKLKTELVRTTTEKGNLRPTRSPGDEKARKAVAARIETAFKKIEEAGLKKLAVHLMATIERGKSPRYKGTLRWEVTR